MSILGNRVLRKEDPRFLRGEGSYVENLPLEGALEVTFVRSQLAHARIRSIDASAAESMPNVQVLTGADVDVEPMVSPPPFGVAAGISRPLVARDVVRYVGEIVAIVVSEDRVTGADAAELVFVDYDPLPVVVDVHEALKDEVLLFPEVGTNVSGTEGPQEHDETLFDGCDVVVSGTVESQRLAPCPLEPRSTAAEVGPDGRITAWLSTQAPHGDRQGLAAKLGLEPEQVRVIAPDVGGGFGAKTLNVEEILVVWLARKLGRPVRWTESRSESMVGLPHGRGQHMTFTIGSDREGNVLAYRLESLADAGAYPGLGSFLPHLTALMASGVYAIPKLEASSRSVATNTVPISAFRGAGRPEAAQAIERAMDALAAELAVDPAEIRRRNFIKEFPYETETGAVYDSGDYEGALDLALRAAGYDELRAEQRRRREEGGPKQLGIGLSTYVEITNGVGETEFGEVEITEDGGAILRTGSFSHGQGHETTFAMIASAQLGIPFERITVVKGDTDDVARGTGTYASKSTQIGGVAARLASDEVVVHARQIVADYLETSPDDIVLDPAEARLHVAGSPAQGFAWEELAARAAADGRLAELKAQHEWKADPSFPFGAHVAVVEVDTETGSVELIRHVAVDDAGTLINPLVAEGQVHGGVATGVAQALYERFAYDEHGTPSTSTFADYSFPSAADLPSWETVPMETPTPLNALGVKGIGESGTIGATPAVHNAVIDALAHLGVTHVDMPANGQNVWRALQEARS